MKRILSVVLIVMISVIQVIAIPVAAADEYALPVLDKGRDYYQVIFPAGLRYSSGWAGTFSYVPNGIRQVLFDDSWHEDWGKVLFSLPKGSPPPKGEQGGSTLYTLTFEEADTILKGYDPAKTMKPWDSEILQVMDDNHKYIGVWGGDKLAQKWAPKPERTKIAVESSERDPETGVAVTKWVEAPYTTKQLEYLNATKSITVKAVDLEKFDPDRYFVMGQVFFTDGTADCNVDGRVVADTAFTVAGAGDFTIHMANGTTATLSGTNIVGTPVALAAGLNTITATGAVADGNIDITIGTAANWNSVNSWSAADGGACGASVPTNADNVYFTANSFTAGSQVLTVDAAATCLDMDWTGATNHPTLSTSGQILSTYGNITLIADMVWTGTAGTIYAYGAAKTITTNALTLTGTRLQSRGTIILGDAYTATGDVQLGTTGVSGSLDTGGFAVSCLKFAMPSAEAKTLTLGASTITCTAWDYSGSNLTVAANTATVNVTGTGAVALGAADWNGADFNLNGTAHTVSGAATGIDDFTRNGTATKTDTVTFTSGTTLSVDSFIMKGNSITNRLLVQSSTLGTAATITANDWGGSQHVDIIDITATNAVDLSAITGNSGDCQGNTGITFTAAAAQISNAAGNWSTLATWQDGAGTDRVPLPQDDVSVSHNVTGDMPRAGKNITFGAVVITRSATSQFSVYGNLVYTTGASISGAAYDSAWAFRGRGAYTYTTNGVTITGEHLIYAPSGSVTLGSNLVANNAFWLHNGGFNTANYTMTAYNFRTSNAAVRTVNFGSSVITLTGTNADYKLQLATTNLTLDAGTSHIIMTNSGVNQQSVGNPSSNVTLYDVTITGAGNYTTLIVGSNTFHTFRVDATQAAKTVTFTDTTTQIVSDFTRDYGTNVITLQGTAAAGWNLTATAGDPISLDYVHITNSTVLPVSTWYAGGNSTDNGGNINWLFTDPALTVVNGSITGLTIDQDGVSAGTASGSVSTSLRGIPRYSYLFDYGLTNVYGSTTGAGTDYDGAFSGGLPSDLDANTTYYWRASVTNDSGTYTGADATFSITPPTVTTVAAANTNQPTHTLNGNITDLGDCSSVYAYFEWGHTIAYGNSTAPVSRNATGAYSATISPADHTQDVFYRAVVSVDGVEYYGAESSFTPQTVAVASTGLNALLLISPMLVFVSILSIGIYALARGRQSGQVFGLLVGIVMVAISFIMFPVILDAIERIRQVI